jgi:mannose-1-phosphate guanylyltransferase
MAGGKGERFWPMSTEQVPKPFLKLIGDDTFIQLTVERAMKIVPPERIRVVLGQPHMHVARKQLPALSEDNFIVEPKGRDTAACIGLAAVSLAAIDEAAVMVVLPADHYIPDADGFVKTISEAIGIAEKGDSLVTIGIKPTRPETGYGYIHASQSFETPGGGTCFQVGRFVEKPAIEKAEAYVAAGDYYWNSGIFVWRTAAVLRGIALHMPDLSEGLLVIRDALASGDHDKIAAVYGNLPRKSIDYGLMEKAENVLMIPADFRWDDVGTWTSLLRVVEVDSTGNHFQGDVLCVDTSRCLVYGEGVRIGTLGVSDLIVVASGDGVLVCDAGRAQDVREIVRRLGSTGGVNKGKG